MDRTLERSTMRKVYLRLLPFAVLSYVFAYIDRINVSFAGLTMRTDLGMSAGTFGFAVGMFYWAYFLFEVPSNVILEKVGARIWIARIMITWGILAGLTAYVTDATTFGIVRFLLGVAEAGFLPGVIYYLGQWYGVPVAPTTDLFPAGNRDFRMNADEYVQRRQEAGGFSGLGSLPQIARLAAAFGGGMSGWTM